jgi:thiamine pyrophosphokinase
MEFSNFKIKALNTTLTEFHSKPSSRTDIYIADGGLNSFLKHFSNKLLHKKIKWVGDLDSITSKNKKFIDNHKNILLLNQKKDFSDLAAILDILSHKFKNESIFLEIYGGLGKRKDHEYANCEEVKQFLNLLPKGGIAYFHKGLIISSLPIKISQLNCRFFSIFANNTQVHIDGAEYSGEFLLQRPSHGLSNQFTKKTLSISPCLSLFHKQQKSDLTKHTDKIFSVYLEE